MIPRTRRDHQAATPNDGIVPAHASPKIWQVDRVERLSFPEADLPKLLFAKRLAQYRQREPRLRALEAGHLDREAIRSKKNLPRSGLSAREPHERLASPIDVFHSRILKDSRAQPVRRARQPACQFPRIERSSRNLVHRAQPAGIIPLDG